MEDNNGSAITVTTPWVTLRGSGLVTIMILLTALIIGSVTYTGYYMQVQHEAMQVQHQAIVTGLNDVFIASLFTIEQKDNLPPIVKQRLEEKVNAKARQKTNPGSP